MMDSQQSRFIVSGFMDFLALFLGSLGLFFLIFIRAKGFDACTFTY